MSKGAIISSFHKVANLEFAPNIRRLYHNKPHQGFTDRNKKSSLVRAYQFFRSWIPVQQLTNASESKRSFAELCPFIELKIELRTVLDTDRAQ